MTMAMELKDDSISLTAPDRIHEVVSEIPCVVVLKAGVDHGPHNGCGWNHIWEEETRGSRFHAYYLKRYGLDLEGDALKQRMFEDIEDALMYGKKIGEDTDTIKIGYDGIVVKISKKYPGSIQTAHPLT